jgi:hypothetical protein
MARASQVTAHTQATAAAHNAVVTDYVSMSDTTAQTIQSAIAHSGTVTCDGGLAVTLGQVFKVGDIFSSNIKAIKIGSVSVAPGPAGTTFAHGLTGTPKVIASPNAVQGYAHGVKADATNISIYHNGGDAVAFFYIAVVTA